MNAKRITWLAAYCAALLALSCATLALLRPVPVEARVLSDRELAGIFGDDGTVCVKDVPCNNGYPVIDGAKLICMKCEETQPATRKKCCSSTNPNSTCNPTGGGETGGCLDHIKWVATNIEQNNTGSCGECAPVGGYDATMLKCNLARASGTGGCVEPPPPP